MKYILLVMLLVLSSCEYQEKTIVSNSGEKVPFTEVIHFTYENHKYIKFEYYNGNATTGGVVHDPNCECQKHLAK